MAKYFNIILSFLCLVPAVYGIKHFSSLSPLLKAFTLLMCLSVLCEIPSNILYANNLNNSIIDHVYVPIQAILLAYAFSFHLTLLIKPNTLRILGVLFAAFSILNTFYIQPYFVLNSYANGTLTVFIIIMILGYFWVLVKSNDSRLLSKVPEVWIFSILLVHLCTALFIYISGDLLYLLPRKFTNFINHIRSYSMMVFYLSIALGIWIHRKQQA